MKRFLLVLALLFGFVAAAPMAAEAVEIIKPGAAQPQTIYDVFPTLLAVSQPWVADSDKWLAQTADTLWGVKIGNAKAAVAQLVQAGLLVQVQRHAAYLPPVYVPTDRVVATGDWFGRSRVLTSAVGSMGGAIYGILAGGDPIAANDPAFVSVPQTIGGHIRLRREAVVALQALNATSCKVIFSTGASIPVYAPAEKVQAALEAKPTARARMIPYRSAA